MIRFYFKTALAALLFTLLCTGVRAQTVSLQQGFEDNGTATLNFSATPESYAVGDDFWGFLTDNGGIGASSEGAMFWGGQDIANGNGGTSVGEKNTLTFNVGDICSVTNASFSFDYNVIGFDAGDDLGYTLIINGTPEADVILIEGENQSGGVGGNITTPGWVTANIPVPASTNQVQLEIFIIQNGGDQFGIDNVTFTGDGALGGCAGVCGITSFGPATTECTSSTEGADNDTYEVSIPFSGADDDASLVVEVEGSAASFTITSGDLAAGTSPLVIQSPAFLEGSSFSVEVTDAGGGCATSITAVTGSVTPNACNPSCDVSILTENVTFFCESLTDGIDNITVDIDYTGSDDGVNVTVTGAINGEVFSGTDLFNAPDGRVQAPGIPEGDNYTVAVSGSGCDRTFPLPIPAGVCAGSDILINEVLYDGLSATDQGNLGAPPFGDPNRDNTFSGGEDEFVEITNIGASTIDIGDYTLSDLNNADIVTVPAGTMLAPGEYFVFFGGGAPDLPCGTVTRESQSSGSAFLGLNNDIEEQVIIKNGTGAVVAQMNYTGMGNVNESLVLFPNADPAGTFVTQTSILDPTRYSPCFDNDDVNLPVELLAFTADARAKYVMLNWETVNEVANDRFAVERSANGRVWERIGTVMASGRDADLYEFKDDNPVDGQNLYRLRQYDLTGAFALYGPVVVEFSAAAGIYPNPAKDELYLRGFNAGTRVSLLDASGKLLRELPAGTSEVNVANLLPGIYMLRISGNKNVEVLRFIKQ